MLDGLASPQVKDGKKYFNFFRATVAWSLAVKRHVSKASSAEETLPLAELRERKIANYGDGLEHVDETMR